MTIAVTATRNALAQHYGAQGAWISAHNGNPSSTGGNEVSGGGYARKKTTWGSPSNGTITGSEVTIDVPAGTYTHAGLWTAESGGQFIDTVAVVQTTLGSTGQLKITPTYTQS